jgi:hypothetical protein
MALLCHDAQLELSKNSSLGNLLKFSPRNQARLSNQLYGLSIRAKCCSVQ